MFLIQLQQALILIALILLGFGIVYAVIIYYRPFGPGWTWVSVFIGDVVNDIAVTAAILVTLFGFGHLELWWMALFPLMAHILDGGPMILSQVIKWVSQKQRNRKLDEELE